MEGLLVGRWENLCLGGCVAGCALPQEVVEMVLHVLLVGGELGQVGVSSKWLGLEGVLHEGKIIC